ncbi:hypothetical protein V6N13_009435 [Hibiscus sabdariffa]
MLLMFNDVKMRHEVLDSGKLDEWLENVGIWNSMMSIPNRRTWLSISGLPIHVWSEMTFDNIASLCEELVQIDIETLAPSSFERARFQIKNDWRFHIDEDLELQSGKLWEANKMVDCHVVETASWMADENIRMVECDEEARYSDVSAEAPLAEVIEHRGQQRKVRQISEVLLSELSPHKREVALNQIAKRGRGRPKMKNTEDKRIVNGSLSDSDFVNRKKVILREVEEVLQLGKLIGAETNGNEKAIVQDIRDGTDSVVFKMREMKRVLKEWNRDSFGNVDVQYRDIVGEIEVLDTRINSDELGSNDLQRTRELHSRLWAVSRLRDGKRILFWHDIWCFDDSLSVVAAKTGGSISVETGCSGEFLCTSFISFNV